MMERIRVAVPRRQDTSEQVSFDVYGDAGSGTIDYSDPLNIGPLRLWPTSALHPGHHHDGHLASAHLGVPAGDGHLAERFLREQHLRPAADVVFEAGPYCFGRFQHAVVMLDAAKNGDTGAATVVTKTINSEPRRVTRVRAASFDSGSDRVTISFVRSPDVG